LLVHATEAGQRLIQATNVADGNQDTVYTDPLTGLGNRRLLDRILKESRQSSKLLAMIMMDLDRFKQINDTLGHGTSSSFCMKPVTTLINLQRILRQDWLT